MAIVPTLFLSIIILSAAPTLAYQVLPTRPGYAKQQAWKRQYHVKEDNCPPKASFQNGVVGTRLSFMVTNRNKKEHDTAKIESYVKEASIQNHEVLKLLLEHYDSFSTPGNCQDNVTLALAMEGRGMQGCVSAGMATVIASLGLTDAFDTIYGSLAGLVVGAYMISRLICVDVYSDILPAAQTFFVCKKHLIQLIASNFPDIMIPGMSKHTEHTTTKTPGMNISYVLDGIMDLDHGLGPLDLKRFEESNKFQKLQVVASSVNQDGKFLSQVFGVPNFFNATALQQLNHGSQKGLFACLQTSMTVPGATSPPVKLLNPISGSVSSCFDAFCFEPIMYCLAVQEGATHILALCTCPKGFDIKTKPGVYEQGVAPLYFQSHGHPKVAEFFEQGSQQFIYAKDLLTLEQGKAASGKVLVPPPKCFHGVKQTSQHCREILEHNGSWNQAHLLPRKVPASTPELASLEQGKDVIVEAVQEGFAAAVDVLAPIVGIDLDLTGEQVSKLVFPLDNEDKWLEDDILTTKVHVPGQDIPKYPAPALEEVPQEDKKKKRFQQIR
eukprot:6711261-Ditylum_brightwellii.AAC.1